MHSKPREAQLVHGLARLQRVLRSLQLSHAFFTDGGGTGGPGLLATGPEGWESVLLDVTSSSVAVGGGDTDGDEDAIHSLVHDKTRARPELHKKEAWSTPFVVSAMESSR